MAGGYPRIDSNERFKRRAQKTTSRPSSKPIEKSRDAESALRLPRQNDRFERIQQDDCEDATSDDARENSHDRVRVPGRRRPSSMRTVGDKNPRRKTY